MKPCIMLIFCHYNNPFSSKHFALQIGAAEIIRIGVVYVGIEIGDLIRDKRRKNIQNCLCSIFIFHGGQHQPLIQHSDGGCRRDRIAALRSSIKIPIRDVEIFNQLIRPTFQGNAGFSGQDSLHSDRRSQYHRQNGGLPSGRLVDSCSCSRIPKKSPLYTV